MLPLALVSALALAPSSTPPPTSSEEPLASIPPDVEEPTVPLAEALVVRPGATCLETERLVGQIRTWFDHERIDARLVVEVVGDADDARKLAFTIRRGEQVIAVRRFEPAPERCADLHAVVGLAIALAIDATLLESVAGERPPLRPPDPPPRRDDETTEPKPEPTPPRPRKRPRRWKLMAEAAAEFSIGTPPDVGGGGRLALRASWRNILDLQIGGLFASSGRERIGEGRALLTAVGGRFDICAGPPWTRLRPRGCVGVLAGAGFAAGQGFDDDQTARVPWVAIPVGVDLEVPLSPRVAFLMGVEGLPAIARPTFEATSATGAVSSRGFARFGGMLEAGLTFVLW